MEQRLRRKVLYIEGMSCTSCEMRIENALKKLDGVKEVKAIFSSSNVYIAYDENHLGLEQIIQTIEKLGYVVRIKSDAAVVSKANAKKEKEDKLSISQLLGIGIILLALYVIIKNTVGFNFVPEVDQSMGYGILFFIGLLTSLHCIAMCGGINLSQCISYKVGKEADKDNSGKFSNLRPSLLYNGGRVISYTVIGGIVGALGSSISFSGAAKGIVAVIAGVFMVIMGLN
ncbi:MAG TPA: heavy metal transporter, partial [Clostridiaceae bacterium]|nr:heavy metal transporter [Clostridiaceae bacterium]